MKWVTDQVDVPEGQGTELLLCSARYSLVQSMLPHALAREGKSVEENRRPSIDTNQGEQKLDGEEFNMITHEDADEIDDDDEEKEEAENSFYRPGLASLFGGRIMQRNRSTPRKFDHLHPFTQVLSVSNVDDCLKLENEAFPASERCTREKVRTRAFLYRAISRFQYCLFRFTA